MKPALTCLLIILLAGLLNGCDTVLPMNVSTPTATEDSPVAEPGFTETPRPLATVDTAQCVEQTCILDGHFLLQNPIPADANQVVDGTYRFGSTQEGLRDIHHGVEFGNPTGTPVLAAADGKVVFAGSDDQVNLGLNTNFYGKVVVIEHHLPGYSPTLYTLYGHLSEIAVVVGNQLVAGYELGRVGRSGSALGSHLHFEVRLENNTYASAVNPELWLTLTPGYSATHYGALAGIILDKQGEPLRLTNIQLEYSPVEGGVAEKHFVLSTYYDTSVSTDPEFHENFVISALTPGWYRFVTIANGIYVSKWVIVESGKLTFLTIPF